MFRKRLAKYRGERLEFTATIVKFGNDCWQTAVCLGDVRVRSERVAGHVWADWPLDEYLPCGDTIRFLATVGVYVKHQGIVHRQEARGLRRMNYGLFDLEITNQSTKPNQ